MFGINEKNAGDFIDLENWYSEISKATPGEDDEYTSEIITKFFISLIGRLFDSEEECKSVFEAYVYEVEELKSNFEFIYNPPQLPSTTEQSQPTIGDEYKKEFAQMYGGYAMLIYMIAKEFKIAPIEVYKWKTIDFLYWGEFLSHQKYVENIK